jgi:hypothetical protein
VAAIYHLVWVVDSAQFVGVARGAAPEGSQLALAAKRVLHTAYALLGPASVGEGYWVVSSGNVTDEMWVDYIKNQTLPEPDDDFNIT